MKTSLTTPSWTLENNQELEELWDNWSSESPETTTYSSESIWNELNELPTLRRSVRSATGSPVGLWRELGITSRSPSPGWQDHGNMESFPVLDKEDDLILQHCKQIWMREPVSGRLVRHTLDPISAMHAESNRIYFYDKLQEIGLWRSEYFGELPELVRQEPFTTEQEVNPFRFTP